MRVQTYAGVCGCNTMDTRTREKAGDGDRNRGGKHGCEDDRKLPERVLRVRPECIEVRLQRTNEL